MATGGDFSDVEIGGSKDVPVASNEDLVEQSDHGNLAAAAVAAPSKEWADDMIDTYLMDVINEDQKMLNLVARGLTRLPRCLLNLQKLEILYMDFNAIRRLPKEFFVQLPNLQWLDISYNFLTELPHLGLEEHKRLKGLIVCHNKITSLPAELARIKSLMMFLCYGNPLESQRNIPIMDSSRVLAYFFNFGTIKQTADLVIENPVSEEYEALTRSLQLMDFVGTPPQRAVARPSKRLSLPPNAVSRDDGPRPRRRAREPKIQKPAQPEDQKEDFGIWFSRNHTLEDWIKRVKDGSDDSEDGFPYLSIPSIHENPPYGINELLIAQMIQDLREDEESCLHPERPKPSLLPSFYQCSMEEFKQRMRQMFKAEKSIRTQCTKIYLRRQEMYPDPEVELKAAVYETIELTHALLDLASIRYELENL